MNVKGSEFAQKDILFNQIYTDIEFLRGIDKKNYIF
jgi:hypothetical protein